MPALNKREDYMLDDNDHKEIAHIMNVIIESHVTPKLDLLVDAYKSINEKLIPVSRIDELEHELKFLKMIVRQLSEDIQQIKEA